jgi:hypothetical protein
MPDEQQPLSEIKESGERGDRFPELAEIQREIELRIRDNKRFLERFMDEDFTDEAEDPDQTEEDFEEL